MRLPFFGRRPDPEAEIFGEAQALLDDGLDRDFVLSLFPDDAEWLEELLETSLVIGGAYAGEEPSYYFEASLKAKFIAGEVVPEVAVPEPIPAARFSPVRTVFASMVVLLAATGLGGVIFGFVTADDSVPGDWNYAFKLAGERLEYSLSRGDGRVDVQINHAEARVWEIQRLSDDGNLTKDAIESFTRELGNLLDLATQNEFGPVQTAKTNSIDESMRELLAAAVESDESLAAPAAEAISALEEVVAATSGGVGILPDPAPAEETPAASGE
jgi:Domain of unknown function (DUF5667)